MVKKYRLFRASLRSYIQWFKSVLLEIKFKNFIGNRIRFELFELRWGFNYYMLPIKRKIKNITNITMYFFCRLKNTTSKKGNYEKELMITNFLRDTNFEEAVTINFGNARIHSERTPIEYNISQYFIGPLADSEILSHYAFEFFASWSWFTKKLIDEDNEIYYDTMFPLNPTEDYFFDRGLKNLEKKYGTKIVSFLAIQMLERYYMPDSTDPLPIGSVCDLQYLFRHKDSLGWFIALLQTMYKNFGSPYTNNDSFNALDIIENLSYIYDILEAKKSYTKIKPPTSILLSTIIFAPLLSYQGMTLYAHAKLLMFEVLGTIPNSANIWDISKIFNAARIIHAKSFYEGLPLKRVVPNLSPLMNIIDFNIELSDKYNTLYYEITPKVRNLETFQEALTKPTKIFGKRFNFPVASTGVTQHFNSYIIKSPKTINGVYFDYTISIADSNANAIEANIPVRVEEYKQHTRETIISFYKKTAETTGIADFKLFIDYGKTQKNFIEEETHEKMFLLNIELTKRGFGDKIVIINSSDMKNLMNQTIWEHSKESVISRSERNYKFFSLLSDSEKAKLLNPKDA